MEYLKKFVIVLAIVVLDHTGKSCVFWLSDPDDPEYQRQMRRPAEVKEDVKQMQDRSRVSLVLNSEAFRKELEEIIDEQLSTGNYPTGLLALQQITDLLLWWMYIKGNQITDIDGNAKD